MSILQKHLDNLPATLLEIKAKKIMALQESVSKGKVTCDECGWEWNLSDGGEDPYMCKCGHDNTPDNMQEGRPPKKYKGEKQMMLYREIDKVFDTILSGKAISEIAEMYKNVLNQMGVNNLDPSTAAYKYLNSDKYAESIISSYIAKKIQAITPSPFGIPEGNLFDMIRDEVKGHAYKDYLKNTVYKLSKAVEKDFEEFNQDEEEVEDDGIVRENENELDLSPLKSMASGIEDELEKIPTNEVVLTTLALVAGIPGILNVIAKAAKTMMQKSGINLSKKQSVLDHIIKVSGEIDGYLDGPFRTILKPFVQDEAKRKKIAGVLKSITLIALGSAGGVNIADADKIKDVVTGLAPDVAQELLQTKVPNMAEFLKGYLKSL